MRALSCDDGDGVPCIARGFSKQVLLVYSVVEPLEDWEPIKLYQQRPSDSRTKTTTSTRFDLKFFSRIVKK